MGARNTQGPEVAGVLGRVLPPGGMVRGKGVQALGGDGGGGVSVLQMRWQMLPRNLLRFLQQQHPAISKAPSKVSS